MQATSLGYKQEAGVCELYSNAIERSHIKGIPDAELLARKLQLCVYVSEMKSNNISGTVGKHTAT